MQTIKIRDHPKSCKWQEMNTRWSKDQNGGGSKAVNLCFDSESRSLQETVIYSDLGRTTTRNYDIPSDVISHFDQSAFRIRVTWGWVNTYITQEILITRYSKLRHRRMIHETRRSKVTHQQMGFIDEWFYDSKVIKLSEWPATRSKIHNAPEYQWIMTITHANAYKLKISL